MKINIHYLYSLHGAICIYLISDIFLDTRVSLPSVSGVYYQICSRTLKKWITLANKVRRRCVCTTSLRSRSYHGWPTACKLPAVPSSTINVINEDDNGAVVGVFKVISFYCYKSIEKHAKIDKSTHGFGTEECFIHNYIHLTVRILYNMNIINIENCKHFRRI